MAEKYACKGGVKNSSGKIVARCRRYGNCPDHPDGQPPARKADVILFKVNLNKEWDQLFKKAGIPLNERSDQRRGELSKEREERAKKLGRDGYIVREQSGRAGDALGQQAPEDVDSGTPVFGPDGLQNVEARTLPVQVSAAGYRLTKAERLMRWGKPPVRLVLEFSRTKAPLSDFPWRLLAELLNTCFGQVDVWANDEDKRGQIVHTVNCGKRQDGLTASEKLLFADSDWTTEATQQPESAEVTA